MTHSARTIFALCLVSVMSAAASAQAPGFGGVNVRQVPTVSPPPSYVLARPVIQPATVFLPPYYDPFVSPFVAANPVNLFAPIDIRPSDLPTWNRPAFTPPVVTLPVVVGPTVTPWGVVLPPRVLPGVVSPATVSTVEPGRYLPYTSWFAVNPATGSLFNGVTNTFFRSDGMYVYNPWTNRYEEPVSGSRFDPLTGVTTRPIGGRFPTVFR